MSQNPGAWQASTKHKDFADTVNQAVRASGELYRHGLGMIASENIVSPAVRNIVSSDLHGRYAEGLPGKRYYQGCDDFDTIEALGIDLAQKVFGANFANIQSTSGTVSEHWGTQSTGETGRRYHRRIHRRRRPHLSCPNGCRRLA